MIDIKELDCGYGNNIVLNGINLSINKGEFLGIVGPNGSGKTTLLRAITGMLQPIKGEIIVSGNDVSNMTIKEIAQKMAVVSQYVESSYIKVEEYVLLGRIPYYRKLQLFESKNDEKLAEQYMKTAGIDHLRYRVLNEISGGEQQLAMIARALCQETDLLLLDEPTSHLDISHQSEIMDLIRRLKKECGITVISVLHDLNLASEYCDKLILLNKGSVYSAGPPGEVLSYKNIEDVYRTVVIVRENPVSGKPHVFVVSEESLKNEK
ncbi:ABC transporter ATP-binding protein [Elusimicrobiota bacterium]